MTTEKFCVSPGNCPWAALGLPALKNEPYSGFARLSPAGLDLGPCPALIVLGIELSPFRGHPTP